MLTELEWLALTTSLSVALTAVTLCFPMALGLTMALVRGPRLLRVFLDVVCHLPLVLPPVVVGYLLLLTFGSQSMIGRALANSFDIRFVFTHAGAVLATVVMVLPFQVRLLRAGVEAIPVDLYETAAVLGASPLRRFRAITLPMLLPSGLSALMAAFAASLGQFGAIITFAANIPGETQTLPLALFAALQNPAGEQMAARLAGLSIGLGVTGLILSEYIHHKARARWGGRIA